MPIDIKPKKKINIKAPSTFNILFYYSIILLLFALISYLFLFRWHIEMKNQISDLEYDMEITGSSKDFQENRTFVFNQRRIINDYNFLFWERKNIRHVFSLLENLIHPLSYLNSVNVAVEDNQIRIEGSTLDFDSLEQQYAILKNFSMKKEFFGWVRVRDIEEVDDGNLLINKSSINLYKDPMNEREIRITVSRDDNLKMIKKITPQDYLLEEGRVGRSLIAEDWYEVVLKKEISPITDVVLSNISERSDEELRINFNFNISIDPIIFDL